MNRAFRDVIRRTSNVAPLQSSQKIISASEIRKTFIDYFCKEHDHMYIRSSPVFSLKDPTLAFTNAGMNQFKGVFLGVVEPAAARVANSQKCIRIGGMHNDLSQVGENGRHHTFFEMLGNWSFGDYFKEESCRMSWDLLTNVFKIPPERLYVTYFKGDRALGLDPDIEVKEIWRKIGVEESRILAFGAEENFWSGSVIGPCGPCTEIHYAYSSSEVSDTSFLVNKDNNAVIELWNLVFTQYDRKSDGTLTKLNKRFVDTGMGFERLVSVLQGQSSNYDTDLFLPLFEVIKNHTGHSGYTGRYDGNKIDTCYRMVADHSRMIAVALSDGMLPNQQNKVRGIIKKTLAIMENTFNSKVDLLKKLTTQVAQSLSDVYPEIEENLPKIHYILDEEDELVKSNEALAIKCWNKIKKSYPTLQDLNVKDTPTIIKGLEYINTNILEKKKTALTDQDVFTLFETYGIPINQVQQIALKLNLHFDMTAYKNFENSIKESDKKFAVNKFLSSMDEYLYLDVLLELEKKNIQPTYDYFKYDYKVDANGKYIFKEQATTVEAILLGNNLVDEITAEDIQDGKEIGIILDRTQLFSEDGGQAGDFGILEIEKDIIFDIKKPVKVKNYVIHFGHFRNLSSNSKVRIQNIGILKLDESRRISIMQNHTALHLLNAALRQELSVTGEKFSKVTPEKLSLNYMVYRKSLSKDKGIQNVEKFIKDFILHGVSVKRKIYNLEEFQSLKDVVFIPGETILKPEVPVIEINSGFKLSREYCTGTHVLNTSDLQDFIITKYIKGSYHLHVIEAVTGEKCSEIRKADSEFKEKWYNLQKKISECGLPHPSEAKDFLQQVKEIQSEINDSDKISHLIRFEILNSIIETKKKLTELFKTSIRNFLTEEIKKVSTTTSENFIVHYFDCYWDFSPEDLEFNDKPALILFKQENSVVIQCVVPETFVSEQFSARSWLTNSVIPLCGTASCRKHQNPNLIYFTSELKCTEAQMRQVTNIAVEYAKNNIKSLS